MINLTFPVLNAIDAWLALWLPELWRIALWGAASGAAALGLYALLSDQAGLAQLKRGTRDLRTKMLDPQLEGDGYLRLARQNLLTSFRLLGKSIGPAMISSIPFFVVLLWLSVYQTYATPQAGSVVPVEILPITSAVQLAPLPSLQRTSDGIRLIVSSEPESLRFTDGGGIVYEGTPINPPTAVIHKRTWWNTLLGNQAGYVRADASVDEIRFRFGFKRFLSGVPGWMTTWELPYFTALIAAALAIKFALTIE